MKDAKVININKARTNTNDNTIMDLKTKPKNNSVSTIFENKIDEDLLTKELLSQKCHFSVSYINKLMKQDKVPYLKNGRSVRFLYSEVVAALQKGSAA